jgi:hypothetical protein
LPPPCTRRTRAVPARQSNPRAGSSGSCPVGLSWNHAARRYSPVNAGDGIQAATAKTFRLARSGQSRHLAPMVKIRARRQHPRPSTKTSRRLALPCRSRSFEPA